jgi:hypothetical protein
MFVVEADSVLGIVVGCGQRNSDNDNCPAKVSFVTGDGSEHTFTSSFSSNTQYREGQSIEILYNPADPDEAEIKAFGNLWGTIIMLTVFSFVMFGLLRLINGIRGGIANGSNNPG